MNHHLFSLPRHTRLALFKRIISEISVNFEYFEKDGQKSPDYSAAILDRAMQLATHFGVKIILKDSINESSYVYWKRTICIGRNPDMETYCSHICHELGHRVQQIVYASMDSTGYEEELKLQREAEEIGYMLYRTYFADMIFIDKQKFKLYKGEVLKDLKESFK